MKKISIGHKLYLSIMAVFLVFSIAFIVFQQNREKQYKVKTLELQLQMFNKHMAEELEKSGYEEKSITSYLASHSRKDMRVTLIRRDGRVVFDNEKKDYLHISNHRNREEVIKALATGWGSTVERRSKTLKQDYYYSATYFPKDGIIIRTALPYNDDLAKSLKSDQHYIWFALLALALLTFVIYRFVNSLDKNITKLKIFASRADNNESLETEDLADFPDDELGEIAERIIKIYKRLESTRQEQDILKRQLTQNIAHELKTPVASIQGYLETILDNPCITEENKKQFLARCYTQTERLTSLLRDISTLNRIDDGAKMMDIESIDICTLVANIQRETALELNERDMTFRNNLPDHIIVKGVKNLLYSVFRNLTDNAIAYAGEGTTITLNAYENNGYWNFCFTDNGMGVNKEHLPRLFERFYRIDKGRSRKLGGTGLGLAIVKNAVLIHGGSIEVVNNSPSGLRFDFRIKANRN